MVRLLPRSTRVRVALFAALAAALVLGLGSYWFVNALRDGLENSARARASDKVDALLALLNAGVAPADVPQRYAKGGGYMISAEVANRCSTGLEKQFPESEPVQVYGPDCVIVLPFGLAGQQYSGAPTADGRHYVAAAEQLDPVGLDTVDTAQRLLWGGVPAAALLVGGVAWLAVRRSLRAVGAIRAEVDGVRAGDLGRRVPVPDSGDEITELAVTINAMLARLDQSVRRQSQFTADASHELRTPLASMRTQLEVQLAHPDRLDWRRSSTGSTPMPPYGWGSRSPGSATAGHHSSCSCSAAISATPGLLRAAAAAQAEALSAVAERAYRARRHRPLRRA
jgi:signal transduction histidine kinase